MEIKIEAFAGTLESSDVQVIVSPNPENGIQIQLESVVEAQFGDAIRQTVLDVLEEMQVVEATVSLRDQGALDCVIRARVRCAVCRAAQQRYDWKQEDAAHG